MRTEYRSSNLIKGPVAKISPFQVLSLSLIFLVGHCDYTVTVYTGDRIGAGTDARVFVKIFGEMRDSEEEELVGHNNPFENDK